jgi:hypothetical protein
LSRNNGHQSPPNSASTNPSQNTSQCLTAAPASSTVACSAKKPQSNAPKTAHAYSPSPSVSAISPSPLALGKPPAPTAPQKSNATTSTNPSTCAAATPKSVSVSARRAVWARVYKPMSSTWRSVLFGGLTISRGRIYLRLCRREGLERRGWWRIMMRRISLLMSVC